MKKYKDINKYFWLKESYEKIIKYYQNIKYCHSILLHSKMGVGEELLLHNVVSWLMCSKKKNEIICQSCKDCKLILKNNHPNFYKLVAEKNQRNISIEHIRIIMDNISNNLSKQIKSVIWISNIENISEKISVALLPILEFSKKNTFVLLNCYDLNSVLLTIKSRCFIWELFPYIKISNINFIKKQNEYSTLKSSINLSNGAPFLANDILKSKIWKMRLQLFQSIRLSIKNQNLFLIFPYLNCKTIEESQTLLFWFTTILSDSIKFSMHINKNYFINEDMIFLIKLISENWKTEILFSQWKEWNLVLRKIKQIENVNYELLLIAQLIKWETIN